VGTENAVSIIIDNARTGRQSELEVVSTKVGLDGFRVLVQKLCLDTEGDG
jgi:hypothetical protein